jgi:hypothetical protein
LKPARRRELARWMRERFAISVSQACRLDLLRRSTWYRRSRAKDQTPLRMRIRELAMTRPRFGYLRIHVMLRREGWAINRKRVHRLYRLEGLQVRMRVRRRKRLSLHRGPVPQPTAVKQHWSMDFSMVRPGCTSAWSRQETTRVYLSGLDQGRPWRPGPSWRDRTLPARLVA